MHAGFVIAQGAVALKVVAGQAAKDEIERPVLADEFVVDAARIAQLHSGLQLNEIDAFIGAIKEKNLFPTSSGVSE